MNVDNYINKLEKEWDDYGFLAELRSGHFNKEKSADFIGMISTLQLDQNDLVPKRLLSLMWFLPLFLEWQRERIKDNCDEKSVEYARFIDEVHNILQEILGVP